MVKIWKNLQKQKKMTSIEAHRREKIVRAILYIIFFSIIFSGNVIAMEWDNVKTYEKTEKYGIIRIKNALSFGETLVEYELLENTDQCLTDCYAYGTVILNKPMTLFSGIEFEDALGKNKQLNYEVYIEQTEEYFIDVPEYSSVCSYENNTIEICKQKIIGHTQEKRIRKILKQYDGSVLSEGTYKWKIEATKKPNEKIDWIASIDGVDVGNYKLTEWAWWDTTWLKCIDWNITYPAALSTIDYTVEVILNESEYAGFLYSDISGGGSDIRFTEGDCDAAVSGELDYFIENYSIGGNSYIWVQLTNTSVGNISMYYDNSLATGKSNVTTVGIVGDNFNGTGLSTEWGNSTVNDGASRFDVSNGYVNVSNSNVNGVSEKISQTNCSYNTSMIARVKYISEYLSEIGLGNNMGTDNINGKGDSLTMDDNTPPRALAKLFEPGSIATDIMGLANNIWGEDYWEIVRVDWNDTSFGIYTPNKTEGKRWTINNSDPTVLNVPTSCISFGIQNSGGTDNSQVIVDWVFARNFTSTEPILSNNGVENSTIPSVTLNAPTNASTFNTGNINFNCSATGSETINNITLYINGAENETSSTPSLNTTETLEDGNYNWTCVATDSGNDRGWAANNFTFTLDATPPNITLVSLEGYAIQEDIISEPYNVSFNVTTQDIIADTCYWNSTFNASITIFQCSNSSQLNVTQRDIQTIFFYSNDSSGNINITNYQIIPPISENSFNLEQNVIEKTTNTFTYNATYATSYTVVDIDLIYNNTNYNGVEILTGTEVFFTTDVSAPDISSKTNITLYWLATLTNVTGTFQFNSSFNNQTVNPISIDNCSANNNTIYNISLKYEQNKTLSNMTITNGSMDVDLKISTKQTTDKFLNFTIQEVIKNPLPICISEDLGSSEYRVDMIIKYSLGDYAQEYYYIDNQSLINNSIPIQLNLYSLLLTDSSTFVVTYINKNGIAQQGVIIHLLRKYVEDGIFREVENGKTDSNGETELHLIEEDVIYKFNVTIDDTQIFLSEEYRTYCDSTTLACRIELSAIEDVGDFPSDWGRIDEGMWNISVNQTQRIVTLHFKLNESHRMNLTIHPYLNNQTSFNIIAASNSTVRSSGILSVGINESFGNSTFVAVVFIDNRWLKDIFISLKESTQQFFGYMGAFLSGLIILAIVLVVAYTGVGMIIAAILGLILVTFLGLLEVSQIGIASNFGIMGVIMYVVLVGIPLIVIIAKRRSRG